MESPGIGRDARNAGSMLRELAGCLENERRADFGQYRNETPRKRA